MSTRQEKSKSHSKQIVKEPKVIGPGTKVRKKPQYKSFYLHKTIRHPGPALPPSLTIARKAIQLLVANAKPIAWFVAIYGLLSFIFVSGFVAPLDIETIKEKFRTYTGGESSFTNNVTILGLLLSSSFRASGDIAAIYQMVFIITSALALIWLFRQQQAGVKVSLKDAYYRGMYPLIPFVMIMAIIGVQVLPAAMGNGLYGSVASGGLAITFTEQFFWFLFLVLLIVLSLYMISISLIALFVVTLPEVTPLNALNEARELVRYRRLAVLIRVIALIVFITIAYVSIVFPSIFLSSAIAQILYFIVTILVIPFAVAYLFVLYRELL